MAYITSTISLTKSKVELEEDVISKTKDESKSSRKPEDKVKKKALKRKSPKEISRKEKKFKSKEFIVETSGDDKPSSSKTSEIINNTPESSDEFQNFKLDDIFNEMIESILPLTPFNNNTIESNMSTVTQTHDFVIPEISIEDEDNLYSPVLPEEQDDSIPASSPLRTAFNFEPSHRPQGGSSPHNITKPRRFSCEAPHMALSVPSIKPNLKTINTSRNKPTTDIKDRELKKAVSLPLTGSTASHWHNTTGKAIPILESEDGKNIAKNKEFKDIITKDTNDLDLLNASLSSDNDFDAEAFLSELSQTADMEMGPIDDTLHNLTVSKSSENSIINSTINLNTTTNADMASSDDLTFVQNSTLQNDLIDLMEFDFMDDTGNNSVNKNSNSTEAEIIGVSESAPIPSQATRVTISQINAIQVSPNTESKSEAICNNNTVQNVQISDNQENAVTVKIPADGNNNVTKASDKQRTHRKLSQSIFYFYFSAYS